MRAAGVMKSEETPAAAAVALYREKLDFSEAFVKVSRRLQIYNIHYCYRFIRRILNYYYKRHKGNNRRSFEKLLVITNLFQNLYIRIAGALYSPTECTLCTYILLDIIISWI